MLVHAAVGYAPGVASSPSAYVPLVAGVVAAVGLGWLLTRPASGRLPASAFTYAPAPPPQVAPAPAPTGWRGALHNLAQAFRTALRALIVTLPLRVVVGVASTLYWVSVIAVGVLIALKIDHGDLPDIVMSAATRARTAM